MKLKTLKYGTMVLGGLTAANIAANIVQSTLTRTSGSFAGLRIIMLDAAQHLLTPVSVNYQRNEANAA